MIRNDTPITPELVKEHGLTAEEYERFKALIGREPTLGGSVGFHERDNGNILVNAMAVGLAKTDEIFYAAASGVGNPIVYLGSKTGRDGIHGATMASVEFDDAS